MREPVIIKKNNDSSLRTSVSRSYDYDAVYSIVPKSETMYRKRGINLTKEQILDILFNLPKELKEEVVIRWIDGEQDSLPYEKDSKELNDDFEETLDVLEKPLDKLLEDKEVISEEIVELPEDNLENVFDVSVELLDTDYSKFTKKETLEFVHKLKEYAKDKGIKVHPATKDPEKIIGQIKDNG